MDLLAFQETIEYMLDMGMSLSLDDVGGEEAVMLAWQEGKSPEQFVDNL